MNLKKFVRSIPDYPKKGILFRDITSLIENTRAFNYALKKMQQKVGYYLNHKLFVIRQYFFLYKYALTLINFYNLYLFYNKLNVDLILNCIFQKNFLHHIIFD